MVQKIKKWFREKHPNLTLSNERLDLLAPKWANGVTDETNLDEHLGNIIDVEVLKMLVSADDALRNHKPVEKKPEVTLETDKTNQNPNQDLLDAITALTKKVEEIEQGKILDAKTASYNEFTKGLHESVQIIAKATDVSNMTDDALEAFKTALSSQSEVLRVDSMSTKPSFGTNKPAGKVKEDDVNKMINSII